MKKPSIKWELISYDFTLSDQCLTAFGYSKEGIRAYRLREVQELARHLRRVRRADRYRLFSDRVKSLFSTFAFRSFALGAIAAVVILALSGCATTGTGTLDVRNDGFCLCVDPSREGWCYKLNGLTAGSEDTVAPQ
jgi:hypothetical protein